MHVTEFAAVARALAQEARAMGLVAPGFRSPPRAPGVDRSLRQRPGAPAAVAVRLRGRPPASVMADMVEGVVVANGLAGAGAEAARARLLGAVGAMGSRAAA